MERGELLRQERGEAEPPVSDECPVRGERALLSAPLLRSEAEERERQ